MISMKGIKQSFRGLFIIGLVLAGISLFLDWYTFQAFDQYGNLIVFWSYIPLFNWHSVFDTGSIFNDSYQPALGSTVPYLIHILYLISLLISLFGVLFKDLDKADFSQKLRFYGYIHIFVVLFIAFYICIVPIVYLLPNQLYFPFIQHYITTPEGYVRFIYFVHIGYFFQVTSFLLTFPYSIFYYKTLNSFEKVIHSPENVMGHYVEAIQEPLDLDKHIREEQLHLSTLKSKKSKMKVKANT
jgi:hypothetical protein